MSHSWGSKKHSKSDPIKDERRHERKRQEEARQTAVKNNIRITYENMISHISRMPDEAMDRDSVVNFVKDLYDWSTYDLNSPIRMPSGYGSTKVSKMLPHGATVDSRGTASSRKNRRDGMELKALDDEAASVVSGSIVSSDHANEKQYVPMGRIMTDTSSYAPSSVAPRQHMYSAPTHRAQQYSGRLPATFDYGDEPFIGDHMPGPPIPAPETPDIANRGPPPTRPATRRMVPRVGTVRRNDGSGQGPVDTAFP